MTRTMLLIIALSTLAAAQPQCSLESVRGTYVQSDWGWVVMPPPGSQVPVLVPAMVMGVASIGFDGQITMSGTVNFAGQQFDIDADGRIEVKPDCTGTLRARVKQRGSNQPAQEIAHRIVVLTEQKEIRSFHMNPGDMGLGTWKRISAVVSSVQW